MAPFEWPIEDEFVFADAFVFTGCLANPVDCWRIEKSVSLAEVREVGGLSSGGGEIFESVCE